MQVNVYKKELDKMFLTQNREKGAFFFDVSGSDATNPECYQAICDYLSDTRDVECEDDRTKIMSRSSNPLRTIMELEYWIRRQGWDIRIDTCGNDY
jgi:hypothetical protein